MSRTLPIATCRPDPSAPLPARVLPTAREASHRVDIDGLRGIAVLSLLAIHSFPSWARGGFIGVDIFFVLSGYLVTEQWLRSPPSHSELLDFHVRRIRRLVPALCIVLLGYVSFAILFGLPDGAKGVGGALPMAWFDTPGSDLAAGVNPLVHLLHLAVIAVFYLLWPLVLMYTLPKRGTLGWIIGVSLIGSLLINLLLPTSPTVAGFFSPAARWWELMAGALLAYAMALGDSGLAPWLRARLGGLLHDRQTTNDLMSLTGGFLLVAAVTLVDYTATFTGWWAILPVVGTLLLLAAGPQAWVNRLVLSLSAIRFYGLISYPLYLWHWPLLCFPVMLAIPLENDVRVIILLASVVMAALTYELAEKPVRSAAPSLRLAAMLGGLLATVGLLAVLVTQSDGLRRTTAADMQPAAAYIATP